MEVKSKKEIKNKLKNTAKVKIVKIIDDAVSTELERDIAYMRLINKKSPDCICMSLNISHSTYYRVYNTILNKIDNLTSD